jgi:hypothetical protein
MICGAFDSVLQSRWELLFLKYNKHSWNEIVTVSEMRSVTSRLQTLQLRMRHSYLWLPYRVHTSLLQYAAAAGSVWRSSGPVLFITPALSYVFKRKDQSCAKKVTVSLYFQRITLSCNIGSAIAKWRKLQWLLICATIYESSYSDDKQIILLWAQWPFSCWCST